MLCKRPQPLALVQCHQTCFYEIEIGSDSVIHKDRSNRPAQLRGRAVCTMDETAENEFKTLLRYIVAL
jgi:hypothetical protein